MCMRRCHLPSLSLLFILLFPFSCCYRLLLNTSTYALHTHPSTSSSSSSYNVPFSSSSLLGSNNPSLPPPRTATVAASAAALSLPLCCVRRRRREEEEAAVLEWMNFSTLGGWMGELLEDKGGLWGGIGVLKSRLRLITAVISPVN